MKRPDAWQIGAVIGAAFGLLLVWLSPDGESQTFAAKLMLSPFAALTAAGAGAMIGSTFDRPRS